MCRLSILLTPLIYFLVHIGHLHASSLNNVNIPYYNGDTEETATYRSQRARLDVYCPEGVRKAPTIIWFHGGGLRNGSKETPLALQNQGVCVVTPNYRLYPKVGAPIYIEDAAASVAWVFRNIRKFGGEPSQIFLSGHSAGGYLASMVGLDKRWLEKHDIDANQIAGIIPFSGHAITHFTVREERGIDGKQPIIDDLAPLFHVRADAPPLILITGDRELELLGRYEENAYLMRMMKVTGHKRTKLLELGGYGHSIIEPALPLLLREVKHISSGE